MSQSFQFWYEFASTYSYIASARIGQLSEQYEISVERKPFLLGPVFKGQGWDTSPFNIYPAKGRYMWRDVERLCDKYGIPFKRPSEFPRNGVIASKIAIIAEEEGWCADFSGLIYRLNFVEDKDISNEELIASALDSLGQHSEDVISRATTGEDRGRLRSQTEEAISKGIFGAPTFVIGEEIFWGQDRLEDALQWCKEHCV